MANNIELIQERDRLGSQICELGNAIRAMQAIQCSVEQRLDWVQRQLEQRHHDEQRTNAMNKARKSLDESALDDVVRRAEAGELAMRVDVVDIDGETA